MLGPACGPQVAHEAAKQSGFCKKLPCNVPCNVPGNGPFTVVERKVLLSLGSSVLDTHDTPRKKAAISPYEDEPSLLRAFIYDSYDMGPGATDASGNFSQGVWKSSVLRMLDNWLACYTVGP